MSPPFNSALSAQSLKKIAHRFYLDLFFQPLDPQKTFEEIFPHRDHSVPTENNDTIAPQAPDDRNRIGHVDGILRNGMHFAQIIGRLERHRLKNIVAKKKSVRICRMRVNDRIDIGKSF
jgi:hypothetical protein